MSLPLSSSELPVLPATGRPSLVSADTRPPATDWDRLRPAWIVSGGLHLVAFILIGISYLFFAPRPESQAVNSRSAIDDVPTTQADLLDPDVGLETSLDGLVPDRPDPARIQGPELPVDPLGLGGLEGPDMPNIPNRPLFGPGGGAGSPGSGSNGLAQRGNRDARARLVEKHGGNDKSEAAVARSLIWLAQQQHTDGHWTFQTQSDPGDLRDDTAATALALLPFLAAGETHTKGQMYRSNVQRGLSWLLAQQDKNGRFKRKWKGNDISDELLYTQALATIAVCEAYGMTKDGELQNKAQAAINFVVNSQHTEGGWWYQVGEPGDLSITGWHLQALKSGEMANLSVPRRTLDKVSKFLDKLAVDGGSRYGYRDRGSVRASMSAVGLLCRQYLGWTPKTKELEQGVVLLRDQTELKYWDVYYIYYATQVMYFHGGDIWVLQWNPKVRDHLVKMQDASNTAQVGSWAPDKTDSGGKTETGRAGGRLVATALSALTLEVYYRHLPLYGSTGATLEPADEDE